MLYRCRNESTVPLAKRPAIGSEGVYGSESIREMVGSSDKCEWSRVDINA